MPTVLPRAPGVTCLTLITTLFAHLQTRKQRLREVPGLAKVTQLGNQELGLQLGWPDPTAHPALSRLCALEPPGSCCPESACSQFHILFHTAHLESEAGNARRLWKSLGAGQRSLSDTGEAIALGDAEEGAATPRLCPGRCGDLHYVCLSLISRTRTLAVL